MAPDRAHLLADGLADLRLDGDDDDVGVAGSLDVVRSGRDTESSDLVAVDIPWLGDGN